MNKPISREEAAKIPVFKNHEEAIQWFKDRYGSRFIMADSDEMLDGEIIHFYHLIIDVAIYQMGMAILNGGESLTGPLAMDFIQAYQSIEISTGGNVHVLH